LTYDEPETGRVVILIVHQAIHLPHLPHSLFNPMQMRLKNGVVVNERPHLQCLEPTDLLYYIIVVGDSMDDELLVIPLDMHGIVSLPPKRRPMQEELTPASSMS
jgi:hypothetical protein